MRKTLLFIALILLSAFISDAQVKLVDPHARQNNQKRINRIIADYNKSALEFNLAFGNKDAWQVEPEKALPHIQEMKKQLEEVESLLLHFDEVEPSVTYANNGDGNESTN